MPDKSIWVSFYEAEKRLLDYIRKDCEILQVEDGCEPRYLKYEFAEGVTRESPPKYIRCIAKLKTDKGAFFGLYEMMIKTYNDAKMKNKQENVRLPPRFPVFYENVEQINITSNDAFNSYKLPREGFVDIRNKTLYEGVSQDTIKEFLNDVENLKSVGYSTAQLQYRKTKMPAGELSSVCVVIGSEEFHDKNGATLIQARKRSGKQYRCNVRSENKSKGVRKPYGLMVLDAKSIPMIFHATPQADRPHSLDKTGLKIKLPVSSEITFFVKA